MLYGPLIHHFKRVDTVSATTKRPVVVLKKLTYQAIVGARKLSSIHESARLVIVTLWFELNN